MNKQNCRKMAQETGITLIALVVTIIVLLILAGITITVVFGEYGIINMAKRAAEATNQAMQNEQEDLSNVAGWMQNYLNGSNQGGNELEQPDINEEVNKVYSVPDLLDRIAPADLFEYEIIENGNFELAEYETLPKKTARIKKIKYEYCNASGSDSYEYLNYDIVYKGNQISEELVIPYKTTIGEEEYTITEVSIGVRYNLPNVKSIIYPDTVTKISNDAGPAGDEGAASQGGFFKNDHAIYIEQVVLPKNLQEIGPATFVSCNFKNMTLPSSVTKIGANAFCSCHKLESIIIPSGVQEIGGYAFAYCENLKEITIPSSVQSIGRNAFYLCSGLTSIELPPNLKDIEYSTFEGCSGLTSVKLPPSVESIGVSAFGGCTGLTSIELPSNLKNIERYAFHGCSKLNRIVIPSSVTTIGRYAFDETNNIQILLRRTREFYSRFTMGSIRSNSNLELYW